jgi:hypothetical protein
MHVVSRRLVRGGCRASGSSDISDKINLRAYNAAMIDAYNSINGAQELWLWLTNLDILTLYSSTLCETDFICEGNFANASLA